MPEIRFVADSMLGSLSKWLRILGYDTEYWRTPGSEELFRKACEENRQILTRNTRLTARAGLKNRICCIKANDPLLQLREVVFHYHLIITPHAPLTRCLICNRKLIRTPPAEIVARVPEYILSTKQLFLSCPGCQKVYWRGTHYQNMQDRIMQVLSTN